ncbi:MAG: hypothetical protein ACK5EP_05910 [Bacteroidota bacterium]
MRGLFLAWAISSYFFASAQLTHQPANSFKIIPEILVKPIMDVMRISRDTIEFKIAEHLDPGTSKLEDVFSQFIGFHVTEEGRIYYNGKEIEAILIDGASVAVFDYRLIAKHLNASMFSSVELIQHYQPNRFDQDFISNDAVAVNLKMKKEFGRKINADIASTYGTPRGWLGKLDISRLGSRIQSINALNKNILADRVLLTFEDASNYMKSIHHKSAFVLHPLATQGFPFKKYYLSNNRSHQFQSAYSFHIGAYQQLNVALDHLGVDQTYTQKQQVEFNAHATFNRNEKRRTQLDQSQSSRAIKILYVHDRLKNNRGEYVFQLGGHQLTEILNDTVSVNSLWINRGLSYQRRKSVYFSVEEKVRLLKKQVLVFKLETSMNSFQRNIEDQFVKSNRFVLKQQFMLAEISSSYQIRKNVFHVGLRSLTEELGSHATIDKRYAYVEHQYRIGKKIQLHTEAAGGKGALRMQNRFFGGFMHHQKTQFIYTKSMFNQMYFQYLTRRVIPEMDIWMMNAMYQPSGIFQYCIPPSDFTATRRVELGKTYHNVYTGLRYRLNIHYQVVNNEIIHRLGFHSIYMIDTIQFNGRNQMLQMLGEGSVFIHTYKLRLSASYQLTSSKFFQSLMGEQMLVRMNTQSVKFIAKTSWAKSFHADATFTVNHHLSMSQIVKNQFILFQHQLSLKYKPWKGGMVGLQWQLIHPHHGKYYGFMDIFLQMQSSKKFYVKCTGLNMLHIRQYQQQYIVSYGVQQVSTILPGRKLQIQLGFAF